MRVALRAQKECREESMDRGEFGRTTKSVSNHRVNIDYYIGL